MTEQDGAAAGEDVRLLVQPYSAIDEQASRGELKVRRIFTAGDVPFESSLQFILHNRLPAGGRNERHIHDDVEKVYYFLSGSGEVSCGPWTSHVSGGDFIFFPAAIEHEIQADEGSDLEFIVCAARAQGEPRGLDGAG
ncbi:MAG: cupin domain-containing protein [Dehalococcoidia bacterium]|jgi:mannose-6-phosphate isomerase-like protein (cupin superfamily)|nr:cupin domain-containing protein [Dehalococcoidia bacterium]